MCHRENHNECTRRRKVVVLYLGLFQDYIVLNLNTTPFFSSWRSYLVDLNFVTHGTEKYTQFINNQVDTYLLSDKMRSKYKTYI